ncbi:hypothetical protein [Spirosoma jeollabukense]
MDRVETATDATIQESAAKECEELILKLWEKRNSWPSGGPLSPILPTLNRLFSDPDEYYHPFFESESDTAGVVGQLIKLHKREMRLFLSNPNLAVSKEAAEASAETLESLTDDLTDDERRAFQFALIERLSESETSDPETQLELNEEDLQNIIYQSKDNFELLTKDRAELIKQVSMPPSDGPKEEFNPFK